MEIEKTKPTLGEGIYSVSDASKILRLPYNSLRYAFDVYLDYTFSKQTKKAHVFSIRDRDYINFYSLMELYVFYSLKTRGVKRKKIIEAHEVLSDLKDHAYPFAFEEIYTDGGTIFFGDDHPIIKADQTLQLTFHELIEPYCEKIVFDQKSKIASKFYPLGQSKKIIIHPKHQLGHPVIEGTNIKTSTIFNMYKGGDSINFLSKIYNLKSGQIKDAIEYAQLAA